MIPTTDQRIAEERRKLSEVRKRLEIYRLRKEREAAERMLECYEHPDAPVLARWDQSDAG